MPTATRRSTMTAVIQDRYGDDPHAVLALDEVPVPTAGAKEVLVRVVAAGVDRGAWHLMTGRPTVQRYLGFGLRGPRTRTPGMEVAGVVEAVGADATGFELGDEVFGMATGAFAELAVAKAAKLAKKPANVTFEEAAAVTNSAVAALQAVRDHAAVQPGESVLVIGASGGVGSFAVQLATSMGAEVTAVCSAGNAEYVRALGAVDVLDHRTTDIDTDRRYDVIIDIAGIRPLRQLRRALRPKGRLVIVGGEGGGGFLGGIQRNLWAALWSPFVGQRMKAFIARNRRADLEVLADLLGSEAIRSVVHRAYPLAEVGDAMAALAAGGVRGKVVVTV